MSYDTNEPDIDAITEEELAGHYLFGKELLRPYSHMCAVVAEKMGLTYPYYDSAGAGSMQDSIIVLWLCSIPPTADEGWSVRKALRFPDVAMDEAIKWSEAKLGRYASEQFKAAQKTAMAILRNAEASRFTWDIENKQQAGGGSETLPKATERGELDV